MTDNQLIELSHLDTMLAQATHIDEITEVRARAEAMRIYVVNIKESRETCQEYAMARIRAERKAGQVMLTMPKRHGARPSDTGFIDPSPSGIAGVKLSQRNTWQTIAKIPDDLFEKWMLERFQSDDDITTSFFYRTAKIHIARMNDTHYETASQRNEEERMHMTESEKELARLAHKAACDVLMAYIPATVCHKIEEAGLLQQALRDAITEWKAQQTKEVGNND